MPYPLPALRASFGLLIVLLTAVVPQLQAIRTPADTLRYSFLSQTDTCCHAYPEQAGELCGRLHYRRLRLDSVPPRLAASPLLAVLMPWRQQGAATPKSAFRQQRQGFCQRVAQVAAEGIPCPTLYEATQVWRVHHWGVAVLSLQREYYTYSCGAHGHPSTQGYVFSAQTGEQYFLSDFVGRLSAEERTQLLAHAEAAFRQAQALKPAQPLRKTRFTFSDGRFHLPGIAPGGRLDSADFYVSPAGLHFEYDPYAIAPYSAGFVQFTLAWTELPASLLRGSAYRRLQR